MQELTVLYRIEPVSRACAGEFYHSEGISVDPARYPNAACYALKENGRVLAAVICLESTALTGWHMSGRANVISSLYVREQERGRGLARALMRYTLARHPDCMLSVDNSNTHAVNLYRSLGFVPIGRTGTERSIMSRRASNG